jgi:hypothetical protein
MIASATSFSAPSPDQVQEAYLTALPRIVRHARVYFRQQRCSHRKADFISEVVALCWSWWQGLFRRGKDPRRFVAALAGYAARAVGSGRRVTGQLKAKDVMNEQTQQRHGFCVSKLPDFATLSENPWPRP